MLYLIYGTNTNKVRAKQKELVAIMQSKQPNVSLYRVTTENWKDSSLEELLASQGLFLAKYIVTLDKLFEDKEIGSEIIGMLEEMKESDHAWIILEDKVSSPNLKKIEKFAYKVFDFNEPAGSQAGTEKKRPLAFDFAEQFAGKNKVGAWGEFIKLKDAELVGEEIHGVLWWQMKSVFLAKFCKNAEESGLTPYSFQKALRLSKGWELKELNIMLDKLVQIYHEAHRGNGDLMVEMESMSLNL